MLWWFYFLDHVGFSWKQINIRSMLVFFLEQKRNNSLKLKACLHRGSYHLFFVVPSQNKLLTKIIINDKFNLSTSLNSNLASESSCDASVSRLKTKKTTRVVWK